jgi:hypothetical protein
MIPLRALAVAPRAVPHAAVLATLGLDPTPHPRGLGEYIAADATGLTPVPGVWVAGNLADPLVRGIRIWPIDHERWTGCGGM